MHTIRMSRRAIVARCTARSGSLAPVGASSSQPPQGRSNIDYWRTEIPGRCHLEHYVGRGIANPLSVIEQLTYLLFIRQLDDQHTLKEARAQRFGQPIVDPIFASDQQHLRWSRFKETPPAQMFETVRDEVFAFMKSLGDGADDSAFADHMKGAIFMMPTPNILANVVDQLDAIDLSDQDTKGDLYEYMLSKIATAGQNGQFRTRGTSSS